MRRPTPAEQADLWSRHHAAWRDTAQVASQWQEAERVDPRLLRGVASGEWWDLLAEKRLTLLVTREYEHLVLTLSAGERGPVVTYFPLPHPSGMAADRERGTLHVASTRNPNQLFEFAPAAGALSRSDRPMAAPPDRPLVPVASRFLPGCLYLHDLALIGGELYGNAVGLNAVIRFGTRGARPVWWPRSIEREGAPDFTRNTLQLNSIAAGPDLEGSYFSASAERPSARRPGHLNFPVDGRGVIFSGATPEPVVRGLTRPHSARLFEGRLWVDNSGYGEVGAAEGGRFVPATKLPGWTRGLCFHDGIAFVGTSKVIPRFRAYAPGLDVDTSVCGVHAVEARTGKVLGSLTWPYGSQIFAVEWMSAGMAGGFPFRAGRRASEREKALFYGFRTGCRCDDGSDG